jgi:hypothetical protein
MPRMDDLGGRLYGMMQWLMTAYADREAPQIPEARDVVELQDALDAVVQIAAVISSETEAGHIPVETGKHAAAMLMVIRDYIQPLPIGETGEDDDGVTRDLEEMVASLREARQQSGHRG